MWKLVSKLINVRACSNPRGISPFTFYIWNGVLVKQEETMHFPVVQSIFQQVEISPSN